MGFLLCCKGHADVAPVYPIDGAGRPPKPEPQRSISTSTTPKSKAAAAAPTTAPAVAPTPSPASAPSAAPTAGPSEAENGGSRLICGGKFEFKPSAVIGMGGFSLVRRGRDVHAGGLVAVKCFSPTETGHAADDEDWDETLRDAFVTECAMLQKLHAMQDEAGAPPVVRLLGHSRSPDGAPAADEDGGRYLVLEMGRYTLDQHLADCRDELEDEDASKGAGLIEAFSAAELRVLVGAMCHCLAFLHSRGLVAVDFKGANVMRFPSGWKLIDCDAILEVDSECTADDVCVTPVYCPPELAALYAREEEGHSLRLPASSHCWCLGMVVLELVLPEPLNARRYKQLRDAESTDSDGVALGYFRWLASPEALPELQPPAVLGEAHPLLHELLCALLAPDPRERLCADALLCHRYFAEN